MVDEVRAVVATLFWASVMLFVWISYGYYSNGSNVSRKSSGDAIAKGPCTTIDVADAAVPSTRGIGEDDSHRSCGHSHSSVPYSNDVRLIIDGCNGPIRWSGQQRLRSQGTRSSITMSLLRTSTSSSSTRGGNSNKIVRHERADEERLDMIPLLQRLVQDSRPDAPAVHSVSVVFDGVSQSKRRRRNRTQRSNQSSNPKTT
jgi:hypothetical protein